MVYSCGHYQPAVYKMRLIPTGNSQKIAIIAATRAELSKLQRLKLLNQFNANIITQPEKSEQYQCFIVVYEFESAAQASLFRLAYSMAKKNGKLTNIKRVYSRSTPKPMRYYAAKKAAATRRKIKKERKRCRTRYRKLVRLMRAGKVADLEAKARQIARELLIIDLL